MAVPIWRIGVSTDWRDPAIKQRLVQAEKCEILVPGFIPLELIRNFPNG